MIKDLIRQGLRFALVGLVNTAVGLISIYAILYFTNAGPFLANGIGYAIGFSVSFMLNRAWTFEHKGPARKVLPRYLMVVAVAYLCNIAVVYYVIHFLHWDPYWAQPAGIVIYSTVTFIGSKSLVFK